MIAAIVVARSFRTAKSRLSPVLSARERHGLAQRMFEHVTGVLSDTPAIDSILIATDDAQLAGAHQLVFDRTGAALSDVVDGALRRATTLGSTCALVFMADLPLLRRRDVTELLDQLHTADVVIVPDKSGHRTNVLGLSPPDRFATRFGHPCSFWEHQRRARGSRLAIVHNERLAFDIDLPDDLRAVTRHESGGARLG